MNAEQAVSRMLRKYPIAVILSDEALQRNVRKERLSGLLVGIGKDGGLRVRVDGQKTVTSWHPNYWRAA